MEEKESVHHFSLTYQPRERSGWPGPSPLLLPLRLSLSVPLPPSASSPRSLPLLSCVCVCVVHPQSLIIHEGGEKIYIKNGFLLRARKVKALKGTRRPCSRRRSTTAGLKEEEEGKKVLFSFSFMIFFNFVLLLRLVFVLYPHSVSDSKNDADETSINHTAAAFLWWRHFPLLSKLDVRSYNLPHSPNGAVCCCSSTTKRWRRRIIRRRPGGNSQLGRGGLLACPR